MTHPASGESRRGGRLGPCSRTDRRQIGALASWDLGRRLRFLTIAASRRLRSNLGCKLRINPTDTGVIDSAIPQPSGGGRAVAGSNLSPRSEEKPANDRASSRGCGERRILLGEQTCRGRLGTWLNVPGSRPSRRPISGVSGRPGSHRGSPEPATTRPACVHRYRLVAEEAESIFAAAGRPTSILRPPPGWACAVTAAWCASAIAWTTARPSPTPSAVSRG